MVDMWYVVCLKLVVFIIERCIRYIKIRYDMLKCKMREILCIDRFVVDGIFFVFFLKYYFDKFFFYNKFCLCM